MATDVAKRVVKVPAQIGDAALDVVGRENIVLGLAAILGAGAYLLHHQNYPMFSHWWNPVGELGNWVSWLLYPNDWKMDDNDRETMLHKAGNHPKSLIWNLYQPDNYKKIKPALALSIAGQIDHLEVKEPGNKKKKKETSFISTHAQQQALKFVGTDNPPSFQLTNPFPYFEYEIADLVYWVWYKMTFVTDNLICGLFWPVYYSDKEHGYISYDHMMRGTWGNKTVPLQGPVITKAEQSLDALNVEVEDQVEAAYKAAQDACEDDPTGNDCQVAKTAAGAEIYVDPSGEHEPVLVGAGVSQVVYTELEQAGFVPLENDTGTIAPKEPPTKKQKDINKERQRQRIRHLHSDF